MQFHKHGILEPKATHRYISWNTFFHPFCSLKRPDTGEFTRTRFFPHSAAALPFENEGWTQLLQEQSTPFPPNFKNRCLLAIRNLNDVAELIAL
jgi:hypothetical protein